MRSLSTIVSVGLVCLLFAQDASASTEPALFRVFFTDGTSIVTYGELARIDDRVIVSMPIGGSVEEPRLHPVTIPADVIDWPRTERHASSTRYQQYLPRADADYQRLTDDVAAVLSEIAQSTDRARAVAIAEQARRRLAEWPRTHFGYRQAEVRDIITVLDAAISRLHGNASARFELSLVADVGPIALEPLATMPTPREQMDQIVRMLPLAPTAADRVALLESALAMAATGGTAIEHAAARDVRRSLERQLRYERQVDDRYGRLTREMFGDAKRAAEKARIGEVERVLARIPDEDERLGRQRPVVVQALTASVQGQLDRARHLRLLRDQWAVRQAIFREYQQAIGSDMRQLVKAGPALEAIRNLEGPAPERLRSLRTSLSGGATHLQRMQIPEYLRAAHTLLVSAWRFAERAVDGRVDAVASGNLSTAWQASSAAAGALMTLARAQQELRALLEPPTLP